MKKIVYLGNNKEVKIGDMISVVNNITIGIEDGVTIKVTEKLVELNPDLFQIKEIPMYFKCINKGELVGFTNGKIYPMHDMSDYPLGLRLVDDNQRNRLIVNWEIKNMNKGNTCFVPTSKNEYDRQELLEEAKLKYPIGTVCKPICGQKLFTIASELVYSESSGCVICPKNDLAVCSQWLDVTNWAKIMPYKFTSEDGVRIYESMKTYAVHDSDTEVEQEPKVHDDILSMCKYFYIRENAIDYIKKYKVRTLKHYENILFNSKDVLVFGHGNMYFSIWGYLKETNPKLFYTELLKLVADDLNGDWEPDFNNERQKKWFIDTLGVKAHCSANYGLIYFKTSKLALKARNMMLEVIQHLFN